MVYKQQSQVHRYNRFHLQPHIHQSFCCMSSLPSSLPFFILLIDRSWRNYLSRRYFSSSQSIQINSSRLVFSFLYCIWSKWSISKNLIKIDNFQYYGYSLHYWTEATQSQKEACLQQMMKQVKNANMSRFSYSLYY